MVAVTHDDPAVPPHWITVEEWDLFGDWLPPHYRAEIIRGELALSASPNRSHQNCVTGLILALAPHLPEGYQTVPDLEWRLDHEGYVARAPRPDLIVAPKSQEPITAPPLLAIEILSPSDDRPLEFEGTHLSRIAGKVLDYRQGGLRWYLEISLVEPYVRLVDLTTDRLIAKATDEFSTEVPFPFGFRLSDLLC
jgi:Uma2 family endonuclease